MEILVVIKSKFLYYSSEIWGSGFESVNPHELSEVMGLLEDRKAGRSYISQLPGPMHRWTKRDWQRENSMLVLSAGWFQSVGLCTVYVRDSWQYEVLRKGRVTFFVSWLRISHSLSHGSTPYTGQSRLPSAEGKGLMPPSMGDITKNLQTS